MCAIDGLRDVAPARRVNHRLTAIDRRLVRDMDADRVVAAADRDRFQQSLRAGRLQKLETMGLADDLGSGRCLTSAGHPLRARRADEPAPTPAG